jgi:hypothetical protein
MKSKFLKAAVLATAAIAAAVFAAPASAKTLNYTFTGYCDGISLTSDGVAYAGERTGCLSDVAGGIAIKIPGGPTKYLDISTSANGVIPVYTFLLDTSALEWWVYDVSGGSLTLVNSGTMTKGTPKALPPGAAKMPSSTTKSAHPGKSIL